VTGLWAVEHPMPTARASLACAATGRYFHYRALY
jgi:hypothetical protein